jgi:hypothetical protein
MSTNALLIDLDPLYSHSLPTPPPTISSATPVTLHHHGPPEEELIRLRRQLKAAHNEIETLEDELRGAVAAVRDERAEKARLDRAWRWEKAMRETKENKLIQLKKRMDIARANGDTKEAQDSAGSDGGESQRRAECNGKMSPPIPATTTRDIGLNTDSPDHAIPPILGLDSQTSKPPCQGPIPVYPPNRRLPRSPAHPRRPASERPPSVVPLRSPHSSPKHSPMCPVTAPLRVRGPSSIPTCPVTAVPALRQLMTPPEPRRWFCSTKFDRRSELWR